MAGDFFVNIDNEEFGDIRSPIIAYIYRKVYLRNGSFTVCVTGGTGSGKSYASLALAETLSGGKFEPEKHCCFSFEQFMKLMKSDPPPGTVIILDESGASFGSRDALTQSNKLFGKLFQTMRFKNWILILTVPFESMIDSQGRNLMNCVAATQKIDYGNQRCLMKFYFIEHVRWKKDPIQQFLRARVGGVISIIKYLSLPLPRPMNIKRYELQKGLFFEKLSNKAKEKMEGERPKKVKELTPRQLQVYTLWKDHPTWYPEKIGKELGISRKSIYRLVSIIRDKGYTITLERPSPTRIKRMTHEEMKGGAKIDLKKP